MARPNRTGDRNSPVLPPRARALGRTAPPRARAGACARAAGRAIRAARRPAPGTLSMRAQKSAPHGKKTWHGAVDERVHAIRRRSPTKSRHHAIPDARCIWYCTWYRDLVESNSIPTASVSRVRGLLSASNFEPGIVADVIVSDVSLSAFVVFRSWRIWARARRSPIGGSATARTAAATSGFPPRRPEGERRG